ncbi:hypothetical protein [Methylopila sp. M107]|uniref:hypothetical protein n=1 Tax=Methylopila sp. M107 TaxID=1101190 RepID=UPI00037BABD8|nr:hypothetical protein [Methylopila sp. M107]
MSELQIDGRMHAAERFGACPADRNLVAPIRTYANDLIGFAEMLEDPELRLSADTRREYRAILRASGAALALHIQDAFEAEEAAA